MPEIVLPPRTSERLLIEALPGGPIDRVLSTSLGRGQLAAAAAERWPNALVVCHFLDHFLAHAAAAAVAEQRNVTAICTADFPPDEVDLVTLPGTAQGDAELTREWLQAGHQRLRLGGRLLASTDNPHDTWLQAEVQRLFGRVTRRASADGVVYAATKAEPLRRVRDFACEFAFRDGPRLLHAVSRPGVFSHRRVDGGARALLESLVVRPGERVLELGCGSGVVSLAAAARAADVTVEALDSNPRAVECTVRGAERNGLSNVTVRLEAEARAAAEQFDCVVTNPPYYSHHQIAELLVRGARAALRPGGRLLVVTKRTAWYAERLPEWFSRVEIRPSRQYWIVEAT